MTDFGRFLLVGILLACTAPARADDFFFQDGDRVVMIGDSITEQHLYSNYVELWTVTLRRGSLRSAMLASVATAVSAAITAVPRRWPINPQP